MPWTIKSLRSLTVAAASLPPHVAPDEETGPVSSRADERRLVVITYHFPPDESIGGMRWAGFTRYLAPLGWRSWVVTAAVPLAGLSRAGVSTISCLPLPTLNDAYKRLRLWISGGKQRSSA